MCMLKYCFLFLLHGFGSYAIAQNNKPFAISGTVRDQQTGETIIGSTVTLKATKVASILSMVGSACSCDGEAVLINLS